MLNSELNIIKNIFISVGTNKLRLAEVYFNNSISEIRFISDPVEWKDINTNEKKNLFGEKYFVHDETNQDIIDGDFALVNLWNSETITSSNMHSKGKYSPFEGVDINATVEKTWFCGNIVADRNSKTEIS
nr:hypothetical protein [Melioribacteraceae bacterium]